MRKFLKAIHGEIKDGLEVLQTPITDEDLRVLRRALWPPFLVGQALVTVAYLVVWSLESYPLIDGLRYLGAVHIPTLYCFIFSAAFINRTSDFGRNFQRLRILERAKKAAAKTRRNRFSRLYFDEIGVIRLRPTLWSLTAISVGFFLVARVFENTAWIMDQASALVVFFIALVGHSREWELLQLASYHDLFPDHMEVQILRLRGRIRLQIVFVPVFVSLGLIYILDRYLSFGPILYFLLTWAVLFMVGGYWAKDERPEDKHRRLVARVRQREASMRRRFRHWWSTDWGVARPWVWLPCVVAFGSMPMIADIVRSRPGIEIFDIFYLLEVVLSALLGLNFYPAARWKMIAAREERGQ